MAKQLWRPRRHHAGELLPHFSKPRTAFLGDMFYGPMAGGDVNLSKICRAYRPTIPMENLSTSSFPFHIERPAWNASRSRSTMR